MEIRTITYDVACLESEISDMSLPRVEELGVGDFCIYVPKYHHGPTWSERVIERTHRKLKVMNEFQSCTMALVTGYPLEKVRF